MNKDQKDPLEPDAFGNASKAYGEMNATIVMKGGETVPLVFQATDVYRRIFLGQMQAGGYAGNSSDPSRWRIFFLLRSKDVPSGKYPIPGEEVEYFLFMTRKQVDADFVTYRAVNGELELINKPSEARVSGKMQFETESVNGVSFHVHEGTFDIIGGINATQKD